MRNWLKTILFVSAFAPVLLVLGAVRWYELGTADLVVFQMLVISLLGTSLPLLIIKLISEESEELAISVKKVESVDYILAIFIAAYFAPVVARLVSVDFIYWGFFVLVVLLVSWFISYVPTHPLLYLFKFRFYRVETEEGMIYTLIARREILSPKSISRVKKISFSMIME